jgi:hypothetical protein
MSVRSTARVFLSLAAVSLALAVVGARAESSAPSPESLRQRRVELFVKAGQQPLKQMANDVFQFATDSERCRVSYGSKACGLPADSLKGGDVDRVFDYYVRQPIGSVVDQQRPSVQRQDWDWNPNSGGSGDKGRSEQ